MSDPVHRDTVAAPPPSSATPSAPVPTEDGLMSTRAKLSLAEIALQLRDEQLAARVVHYKEELATSPELDAVTAHVVAELQALRKVAGGRDPSLAPPDVVDRAQIEIELIQAFKVMLARLFRADKVSSLIERKVAEASKRFARLFFESELHDKIRGSTNEVKKMAFFEQALYHVFARNESYLRRQLDSFDYESPEVLADAKEALDDLIKEKRNQFLGRTTPELNALVVYLNESLLKFFSQELPPAVGELAWEVVKEARLADAKVRAGYKISSDAFPRFRQSFERFFLHRLVGYAEDEMLRRVREGATKFRGETIRFVADPRIFTDVCELVCDGVYDFLYNDGFLDLPSDWRARLAQT